MSGQLVAVPFHGDVLEASRDDAGGVWVSVRAVCDSLGIDRKTQQVLTRPSRRTG